MHNTVGLPKNQMIRRKTLLCVLSFFFRPDCTCRIVFQSSTTKILTCFYCALYMPNRDKPHQSRETTTWKMVGILPDQARLFIGFQAASFARIDFNVAPDTPRSPLYLCEARPFFGELGSLGQDKKRPDDEKLGPFHHHSEPEIQPHCLAARSRPQEGLSPEKKRMERIGFNGQLGNMSSPCCNPPYVIIVKCLFLLGISAFIKRSSLLGTLSHLFLFPSQASSISMCGWPVLDTPRLFVWMDRGQNVSTKLKTLALILPSIPASKTVWICWPKKTNEKKGTSPQPKNGITWPSETARPPLPKKLSGAHRSRRKKIGLYVFLFRAQTQSWTHRRVFLQKCCPLKGDAEREMRLLTDMYGEKQCRHEPIPRHAAHDIWTSVQKVEDMEIALGQAYL